METKIQIKMVYLLGIGGIGMSALARYYHALSIPVFGYDKTSTTLTSELEKQGIKINYLDQIDQLPDGFNILSKEDILIIYTPAIPKDHKQFNYLLDNGYILKKRSKVLGEISAEKFTIAVAGTHGKTTTSSMITWMLHNAGINCTAFLGGIATNFNSNYVNGDPGNSENKNCIVLEADEFDRSFLTLSPQISVITSMDADHLDIYGESKELEDAYCLFAERLMENGTLFLRHGLQVKPNRKYVSYGLNNESDLKGENVRVENGFYIFDLKGKDLEIKDLKCGLGGRHNVENAVAACAVALEMGLSNDEIKEGVETFLGVKRRFETVFRSEKITYIDDYAHHPTELNAAINSAKELFPGKKITGIFQPHLYSRTRDFADGFKKSLSLLDNLILLDIYPARELPIEGIESKMILPEFEKGKTRIICSRSEAISHLLDLDNQIVMTLGAGDIDTLIQPIKEKLELNQKGEIS